MLLEEEFAKGMGQRPNGAVVQDAQIKSFREEYALNMEQRPSDAA